MNQTKKASPVIEVIDADMTRVLRGKTAVERLRIVSHMWESARVILRSAIRAQHPGWSESETELEIAKRISHGAVIPLRSNPYPTLVATTP